MKKSRKSAKEAFLNYKLERIGKMFNIPRFNRVIQRIEEMEGQGMSEKEIKTIIVREFPDIDQILGQVRKARKSFIHLRSKY